MMDFNTGVNPFLLAEDDYISPNAANSNPFLMGGDDFMDDGGAGGGNDNPFLSQTAASVGGAGTNPFAFDATDLEPAEGQPADFGFQGFGDTNMQQAATTNQNFFIDTTINIPTIVPQKPTDLDLKYTHTVEEYNGPKRPPPPRPPPSKETQDLIMSVMGEMDATSTHLLDRIPPTRTPSPVSMRDLHSPSPTPEPIFGDLLDVSDAKTETLMQHQEDDFMSMGQDVSSCDINQNPPVEQPFMQPQQYNQQQPMMPSQPAMMQPQQQPMMQAEMMQQQHMMENQQQPMMQAEIMMQQQPHMMENQQQPMMQAEVMMQPQPFIMQQQKPPELPLKDTSPAPQEPLKNIPPSRPGPPVRPPRPVPPQIPPTFAQAPVNPSPQIMRPPKPPPPSAAAPPPPPIESQYDEMFDMFGAQPTAPKTTADIMNLYKAKQDGPVDLLSIDTMEPPPEAMDSISENNSRKSSGANLNIAETPQIEDNALTPPQQAQDSFLSPQNDMHMDTSDSQSKESVSSVTFNPFAAVEETSPTNPSVIPSQEFGNNLEYNHEDNFNNPSQSDENNTQNIFGTADDNFVQPNDAAPKIYEVQKHDYDVYHPESAPIFGSMDNSSFQKETPPNFATTETSYNTNIFVDNRTIQHEQDPPPIFGTTIKNDAFENNDAFGDNQFYEEDPPPIFGTTPKNKPPPARPSVPPPPIGSNNQLFQQEDPPPIFGTNIKNNAFENNDAFGVNDFEENPPPIFGTTPKTNAFEAPPPARPPINSNNQFQPEEPVPIFGTTPKNTTNTFATPPSVRPKVPPPPVRANPPKASVVAPIIAANTNDPFGNASEPPAFGSSFGGFGGDQFDAFSAKFESAKDENKNGAFDAFSGATTADTWGNDGFSEGSNAAGFGGDETFDAFLALREPPKVPQSTPCRMDRAGSLDSDEDKDFSVVIRPKTSDDSFGGIMPVLAPPPVPQSIAFSDESRINPFDQSDMGGFAPVASTQDFTLPLGDLKRTDSQETPPTPLFDDDVSQPLEDFPRIGFAGEGWEMQLRQPNKKKITGQRFWKKIFVRIVHQQDCVLLQLFNTQQDKDPFQELPLQPCYSVSDISAQQYDNFGKIFTLKLQYIFYKERPGVRPGQVKKAERITNKLSQFAAYAIQGDYQGCKEFGSDLKKLGLPVEHAPQVSQLMKLGSLNFEDLKTFSVSIEEALFTLQAHRDRALHYKMEEVQVTAVDELYVEQDSEGHIEKQIARVRLFFLGFLTGMPDIELGVNDMRRQGKEVVGRHDIIPVVTEEWIRLENVEFHSCVQQVEYNDTHIIKFKPPDACYIELLRFRIRPPKNRELPLQLKAQIVVTGHKIELRADVLVPGFASRKLGQVPCEDVMIRFPIPECWIYMFRVEKHFRYGSVKSAHRRTGKIKGIERILGTVDTLQESLIEVTSGQAKYEHQHRAIVWRCPRLPKEGQGAYTTHNMVCRLSLTSYDQMPEALADYAYVEFTMPATQASHTTVRSVSLQNSDSDEPPEKYVRYLARHEYRVGIEHTEGDGPNAYAAATRCKPTPAPIPEEKPKPIPEADSSSDSE